MEVPPMDGADYGELLERLFFSIMARGARSTPRWLIRVERANVLWDCRGIDGFAFVYGNTITDIIWIPIQIKASRPSADEYFRKHPWAVDVVAAIVVHPKMRAGEIRAKFYAELGRIRREGREAGDILLYRYGKPITKDEAAIMRLIDEQRARPDAAPSAPKQRSWGRITDLLKRLFWR